MAKEQRRHEFRVVVDGIELADDALHRINAAVQKAVTVELAGLDLKGDFRVRFPSGLPRPPWWGIWIDPIRPDQLERAGIVTPEEFGGRGPSR